MQIVEMITRKESNKTSGQYELLLVVKIGNTEYAYPLNEWAKLAAEIIEETETHYTEHCRASHRKLREMKLGPKYCPVCGELL